MGQYFMISPADTNYQLIDSSEQEKHELRDKQAYKTILKDWFDSNTIFNFIIIYIFISNQIYLF